MYTNLYHDDPASAAFIIASAAAMDGLLNTSSYWVFSDVFEEGTLLPVPFHGGFGLLTIDGTPKPAFRAFQLLHGTGAERFPVTVGGKSSDCLGDVGVLATTLSLAANATEGRTMRVFVWNHPPTFGKNLMAPCNVSVDFSRGSTSTTPTHVRMARIDVEHANPMAAWTAMGSPTYPSPTQLAQLEVASELVWEDVEAESSALAQMSPSTPTPPPPTPPPPPPPPSSSLTTVVPAHGLVIYDLALE